MLEPRESLKLAKTIKTLTAENDALRLLAAAAPSAPGRASDFESSPPPPAPTTQREPAFAPPNTFLSFPRLPDSPLSDSTLERPPNTLESAVGSGAGVLDLEGQATFLGRGAGALFLIDTEQVANEEPMSTLVFPFMSSDPHVLAAIPAILPTSEEAEVLLGAYANDIAWMYHPTSQQSLRHDLSVLYRTSDTVACVQDLHPHRLAALFAVFALAEIFTTARSHRGILFFNTSSALLTVNPHNFLCQPTLGAVEALHTMVSFLFCLGDRDGAKAAWPLLGLCLRTAQSMGLHKDASKWGMAIVDAQERSRVFWETLTYDLLQSLNFGRPYSMPLHFVQCPTPDQLSSIPPTSSDVFHSLKYDLGLLFGKVADLLAPSELPAYHEILRLDGELKAREAKAPAWLRLNSPGPSHPDATTVPQKHMVSLLLHKALLALHRPYFAKAILYGDEPMLSTHAASFNACIISARKHNLIMRSLLIECPKAAYRWWFFLFHTFTAAIIQASVLLRAPKCMLADDVRTDFDMAYSIFVEVAPQSPVARRALPILSRLRQAITLESTKIHETDVSPAVFDTAVQSSHPTSLPFPSVTSPCTLPSSSSPFIFSSAELASLNPAGALMASGADPAFWDIEWTTIDSLDHTLLFWNPEGIAGVGGQVTPLNGLDPSHDPFGGFSSEDV